jgi:hypothetical protein
MRDQQYSTNPSPRHSEAIQTLVPEEAKGSKRNSENSDKLQNLRFRRTHRKLVELLFFFLEWVLVVVQ